MTAVTFLSFVGVLALVLTSEARLSYTKTNGAKGNSKVYYTAQGVREIYKQVSESLTAKYHVTSELTVKDITALTAEFVKLIRQNSSEIRLAHLNLDIKGLQLSEMKVPNRSFVVHSVGIMYKLSGDSLTLLIMVPEVEATFSSKHCEIPTARQSPCTLVYTFRKILVGLKIVWPPRIMGAKPNRASITRWDVANLSSRVLFDHVSYPDTSIQKGDELFRDIMDRMHRMMPDQSRANNLLTHFAQLLVS